MQSKVCKSQYDFRKLINLSLQLQLAIRESKEEKAKLELHKIKLQNFV
jgi:hypothetical protein